MEMEKNDEDASLYQTMMGTDPGGDDPAAPAAGGAESGGSRTAVGHVPPRTRERAGNAEPTAKLAVQFTLAANAEPCAARSLAKSSAGSSHGNASGA